MGHSWVVFRGISQIDIRLWPMPAKDLSLGFAQTWQHHPWSVAPPTQALLTWSYSRQVSAWRDHWWKLCWPAHLNARLPSSACGANISQIHTFPQLWYRVWASWPTSTSLPPEHTDMKFRQASHHSQLRRGQAAQTRSWWHWTGRYRKGTYVCFSGDF